MKVNSKIQNITKVQDIKQNQENRIKKFKPSSGSSPKTVDISTLASELSRIEDDVQKIPDVRTEKVNQIKESIDNGSYHIDEEKLADVLSRFI